MRRLMLLALLVGVLAESGCVETSFPEGLPCVVPDRACPPGQQCFDQANGPHCFSRSQPDAGGGACDPVVQGCGGGMACYWRPPAMGGPTCAPAGSGTPHTACATDSQCMVGAGCVDGIASRECAPYCRVGQAGICAGLDVCMQLDATTGACEFGGCDVFTQTCAPTEGCYYDQMHHSTVCTRTPGTATQGMGCTLNPPFSCAKGSQCTNCGGSGRCARFCDRTHGDSDCQDLGVPCAPIENNLGLCKPSGC